MSKYIGWVPTVGGRLSYSIIGETNHPATSKAANVADEKKRRILCIQTRTLTDSALPLFKAQLAKILFKLDGKFTFFVDAQCSNDLSDFDQSLKGHLYILKNDIDKVTDDKICKIVECIKKLNECDIELGVDNQYSSLFEKTLTDISDVSLYTATFILERDGIVEIDFSTNDNLEHILSAQFFFFLKDIAHRHQHHHPKTDTILDIYEKTYNWQNEVLRSLYKRVLDFKRSRNEWVCSSAIGILTYIKSFKAVCKKNNLQLSVSRNDDFLMESIKTAQEELRHLTLQKTGYRNFSIATGIGLLGLTLMFSSLYGVVTPQIKVLSDAGFLRYLAESMVNTQINLIIYMLILTMIISMFVYKEFWFMRLSWNKDVLRIFIAFRTKWMAAAISLLISFLIFYFVYIIIGNY